MTPLSQSNSYADELFVSDDGMMDPCWVVADSERLDLSRSAVEAVKIVGSHIEVEDGLTVTRVRGRCEWNADEGWRFVKDDEGHETFWEVCTG